MSPNPQTFLDHLLKSGYHPRSDKHSNCLAEAVVADLVTACPRIAVDAGKGLLVYDLNFTLQTGTAEWNVDLVLGEPGLGSAAESAQPGIKKMTPARVRIAVEIKSVMTEHHKAVKNRKRDFEAHKDHVHRYHDKAVAAGLLVVNAAPTFSSPLRQHPTVHRNPDLLIEHCVKQMRAVAQRGAAGADGLDASGVIVVRHTNLKGDAPTFVTQRPAPQVGDPLHYDSSIRTICSRYAAEFP